MEINGNLLVLITAIVIIIAVSLGITRLCMSSDSRKDGKKLFVFVLVIVIIAVIFMAAKLVMPVI